MNFSQHGGAIREFAESFNLKEKDVADFSGNLNPLGMSENVRKAYGKLAGELEKLPDPQAKALRQEIARHYPVWPENVIPGNGAIELLRVVIRTLAPKRALIFEPCSTEYRRLLNLNGAEVRSFLLNENENFSFSLQKLLNAMLGVDIFIIGNPNNPTGTGLVKDELMELLKEARRRNIFTVIDETHVDWRPERSLTHELKDNSFFFVIRSLNYFHSLAGIRCAYGLGARKLVEKLEKRQTAWSVNRIAQFLAIEALRDQQYHETCRDWYQDEFPWFKDELKKLDGLKVYPSFTNFLLIKLRARLESSELLTHLAERRMLLRACNDFVGLDQSYIRVSLRQREENMNLIAGMRSWLETQRSQLKVPLK